jgi:hypothetical protein
VYQNQAEGLLYTIRAPIALRDGASLFGFPIRGFRGLISDCRYCTGTLRTIYHESPTVPLVRQNIPTQRGRGSVERRQGNRVEEMPE